MRAFVNAAEEVGSSTLTSGSPIRSRRRHPAAVLRALAPGNKGEREMAPGTRPYPALGQ
jgi:hypothetical protein